MFRVSTAIFAMTICSASFIYSMDSAPSIMDNQMIAWKIVLQHGVEWFDYIKVQSLAVSKDFKKLLRDTAECRKTYLTKRLNLNRDNMIWHKYGAMCGETVVQVEGLYRYRFYLQENMWAQPWGVYSSLFQNCLSHRPIAYFNNRTAFCFYAYGKLKNDNEKSGSIIKWIWHSPISLCSRMCLSTERCMTNMRDKQGNLVELKIFLEFPVLLKSFLESRIIRKGRDNWWVQDCDVMRIFALEGVTIPKNYKKHKQYFSTPTYASFDDLPKMVRRAVMARYKVQEKNS